VEKKKNMNQDVEKEKVFGTKAVQKFETKNKTFVPKGAGENK